MQLGGANGAAKPAGEERLPGTGNCFIGNDPTQWRTGISTYAKVRYQDIYPGIDLLYYGDHRELEYDFVVAPGADPNVIRLSCTALRMCGAQPTGTWSSGSSGARHASAVPRSIR